MAAKRLAGVVGGASPPSADSEAAIAAATVECVVDLYVEEGLSTYRIAAALGIDRQRVTRMLRASGVAMSPRGLGRRRPPRRQDRVSERELRQLYVDQRLSSTSIGEMLDIPSRRVRELLRRYGIERRHRGGCDRRDRLDADPDDLEDLYVSGELPAREVGDKLGLKLRVVLRSAHSHEIVVRAGGNPSERGDKDIRLIEALYLDPAVRRALRRHDVPIVNRPGVLWERFPTPVGLTGALLADLYLDCGLSSFQVELVTGQPGATVMRRLREEGIERRPPGGLSPFMLRWRAQAGRPRRPGQRRAKEAPCQSGADPVGSGASPPPSASASRKKPGKTSSRVSSHVAQSSETHPL
jgi:hypothetical protein